MGPKELAAGIRDAALGLGFARVGFAPVEPMQRGEQALGDWLKRGMHGEMAYMATLGARHDARAVLPEARSLVVVALPYARESLPIVGDGAPRGEIARYARGTDYHRVLKVKLEALADACARLAGRPVLARPCVDTAPLLEREAAHRAGVGFIAKSTMLIVPGLGSYVLLGELLLAIDLEPDTAAESKCGTCRSCLDACPTGAFTDAFVLDARRCISYLTIEKRGSIDPSLRPLIGRRVFGCDVCQEVCPFNASKQARDGAPELSPRAELTTPDLEKLLGLGSKEHARLVRGTALRRISRAQLARNAAIALGNSGEARAVPALARAARQNSSPLVRAHAAWALGRLGGEEARGALLDACNDPDPEVRREAEVARERDEIHHGGTESRRKDQEF